MKFLENNYPIVMFVSILFVYGLITGDFKPFLGSLLGAGIGTLIVFLIKQSIKKEK